MIPIGEMTYSGTGREWKKSIPIIQELEGNEKNIPNIRDRKGNEKKAFPNFGNGNQKAFITGNRRERQFPLTLGQ